MNKWNNSNDYLSKKNGQLPDFVTIMVVIAKAEKKLMTSVKKRWITKRSLHIFHWFSFRANEKTAVQHQQRFSSSRQKRYHQYEFQSVVFTSFYCFKVNINQMDKILDKYFPTSQSCLLWSDQAPSFSTRFALSFSNRSFSKRQINRRTIHYGKHPREIHSNKVSTIFIEFVHLLLIYWMKKLSSSGTREEKAFYKRLSMEEMSIKLKFHRSVYWSENWIIVWVDDNSKKKFQ